MSTPANRFVFALAAAAVCLLAVGGCSPRASKAVSSPVKPKPKVTSAAKDAKPVDQALSTTPNVGISQKGLTFKWVEQEQVRMTASARQLEGNDISGIVAVSDFSGKLYQDGKLTAVLHAPKAVVDTAKRVITATGGVTIKSLERDTVAKAPG